MGPYHKIHTLCITGPYLSSALYKNVLNNSPDCPVHSVTTVTSKLCCASDALISLIFVQDCGYQHPRTKSSLFNPHFSSLTFSVLPFQSSLFSPSFSILSFKSFLSIFPFSILPFQSSIFNPLFSISSFQSCLFNPRFSNPSFQSSLFQSSLFNLCQTHRFE